METDPTGSAAIEKNLLLLFGTHLRERITSRIFAEVGQSMTSRSMPIPQPPVGGRPYFEGADVVGVVVHCFFIARILGLGLLHKAVGLVFWIIELREGVCNFASNNEQLKRSVISGLLSLLRAAA